MTTSTFKEFGTIVDEIPSQESIGQKDTGSSATFKEFGTIVDERPLSDEDKPVFKDEGTGILGYMGKKSKGIGKAASRGLVDAVESINTLVTSSPTLSKSIKHLGTGDNKFGTKIFNENVNEFLEDPDAGHLEGIVEKATSILPFLFAGGPATLAGKVGLSAISGGAGESVKALGGGETAQTIAEIIPMLLSGGKKIPSKGAQKEGLEFLRKAGLTEKEIAPLVKSEKTVKKLGYLAKKGGRTERAVTGTQEALGKVFGEIKGTPTEVISEKGYVKLGEGLSKEFDKLPSSLKDVVKRDIVDLAKKPVHGADLMELWGDINHYAYDKGIHGAGKLHKLKAPIAEALGEVSPKLAKDFDMINKYYSKFKSVEKSLGAKKIDLILNYGKPGTAIYSLYKYGAKALPKIAATTAAASASRRVMSEMIINPRLQNLSLRMMKAAGENKVPLAKKLQKQIELEFEKSGIDLSEYDQDQLTKKDKN